MPSDDPAIRSDVPTGDDVTSIAPPDPGHQSVSTGRLWAFSLLAALVAGLSAWGGGEAVQGRFRATLNDLPQKDRVQRNSTDALNALIAKTTRKKAIVAYGLLGGFLGLYLGLAGGLARRSTGAALTAAIVGLILGAGAGAGLAQLLTPAYYWMFNRLTEGQKANDILSGLMIHAGIWAFVGLAGGLALGLGMGGRDRIVSAALGGVLGALIATVAFELIGGAVFPAAGTAHPVALNSSTARLIAHLLVAFLVTIGAVLSAQHLRLSKSPASARV